MDFDADIECDAGFEGMGLVILEDANACEKTTPRSFLVFDKTNGAVVIADDYETSNDPTARDFVVDKAAAIRLAAALLDYAKRGSREI